MSEHHRASLVRGLCVAAAILSVAAQPVPAQEEDGALEEILVTARKRSESLQDVPISISAVSRADLVNKSTVRLEDALGSIANVAFESDSLGGTNVNIRGITSSTNNFGIETAVGLYVDEVYLSRPTAFNQSTLDIERIEVLRGRRVRCSAAIRWAGSSAWSPRIPTRTFRSAAMRPGQRQFSSIPRYGLRAGGRQSGFRLSVSKIDRDGWLENRTSALEDLAGEDSTAVRAKVKFAPSDALDVIAAFDYAEDKSASGTNGSPPDLWRPSTTASTTRSPTNIHRQRRDRASSRWHVAGQPPSRRLHADSVSGYRPIRTALQRPGLHGARHPRDGLARGRDYSSARSCASLRPGDGALRLRRRASTIRTRGSKARTTDDWARTCPWCSASVLSRLHRAGRHDLGDGLQGLRGVRLGHL